MQTVEVIGSDLAQHRYLLALDDDECVVVLEPHGERRLTLRPVEAQDGAALMVFLIAHPNGLDQIVAAIVQHLELLRLEAPSGEKPN